jgi:hypothetical protein
VRIVTVDRERFQGNKEFDEMRLVRVNLKPRLSEGALEADDVAVWVTFYDRNVANNTVVPTGATVPEEPLRIDGAWAAGEQKAVTATYILPRGFPAGREGRHGGAAHLRRLPRPGVLQGRAAGRGCPAAHAAGVAAPAAARVRRRPPE